MRLAMELVLIAVACGVFTIGFLRGLVWLAGGEWSDPNLAVVAALIVAYAACSAHVVFGRD